MNIESVNVHAFITDADGSHYCDASKQTPSGWCVYLRTVTDAGGNFDVPDEWDFTNEIAALEWANQLSAKLSAPVQTY